MGKWLWLASQIGSLFESAFWHQIYLEIGMFVLFTMLLGVFLCVCKMLSFCCIFLTYIVLAHTERWAGPAVQCVLSEQAQVRAA